jgi:hypothetical protein
MMALRNGTDQLVDSLVLDVRPVPRGFVAVRLAVGVTAGAAISMALLMLLLGARPDLAIVLQSLRFWSKAGYMVATAAASLLVAARLARPGSSTNIAWIVPLPVLLFLPAAILEMANTNPSQWGPLLLGTGWQLCTWLVLLLSLPIYAGLWWAFRSFAPTETKMTGAVTGLCASAIAAVIYCLHCPSDTAVFALVWYTLAFAIAALLGSAFGRRLLHW